MILEAGRELRFCRMLVLKMDGNVLMYELVKHDLVNVYGVYKGKRNQSN